MIKSKIETWESTEVDQADIVARFTQHFSAREVLDCVDVWIDTVSPMLVVAGSKRPKEAFFNGGAVFATIVWLLGKHDYYYTNVDVETIMKHYAFDNHTVSPRCALRKSMCARLHLRQADRQLSRLWPVDHDLIEAIVCKLDNTQEVYDLSTDVLDAVLHNRG